MPPSAVEVVWEVARDDAMRQHRPQRHGDRASRVGALGPRRSRRPAARTGRTGTASAPAACRARSAARGRCRRRAPPSIASASPSRPASTTSSGYFTAYRAHGGRGSRSRLSSRRLHLRRVAPGGSDGPTMPRQHLDPEAVTLDQYRSRYAQYHLDPALQAAHAACPWIVTWDDHEVENNYAARSRTGTCRSSEFLQPPRRRLPGVLRAHAAARTAAPRRAVGAAVSPPLLRDAGRVLRARHPPVPHRPAVRRWARPRRVTGRSTRPRR